MRVERNQDNTTGKPAVRERGREDQKERKGAKEKKREGPALQRSSTGPRCVCFLHESIALGISHVAGSAQAIVHQQ